MSIGASNGWHINGTGAKYDSGKPQLSLLPWDALEAVARVLEYGIRKYGVRDSWRTVPDGHRRYVDAALRHLAAVAQGEDTDSESGLPHLAHAACSALFALVFAPSASAVTAPAAGAATPTRGDTASASR